MASASTRFFTRGFNVLDESSLAVDASPFESI
jgi:hypothetical protein